MKWAWERIKIGVVPLVIVGIPVFGLVSIWGFFGRWGLHMFHRSWIDIPLSTAIVGLLALLDGMLLLRPTLQRFFKNLLPEIPIIGPILLRIMVPKDDLGLVEIQTFDGNWEYALCLHVWEDKDETWYRVHTLGVGSGRLFSRVRARNIRLIATSKQHEAWMIVLSMGLLSGDHKSV
ncbi:hypothetical protein KGO95_04040 [Patescibacteria group bacterium]|nr:hypothetical protein [Patescibacteria group bacterium]